MVTWPNDCQRTFRPGIYSHAQLGRDGQTWPVRAERGGYLEFCRRLAPVLDGRAEVPVRPAEVIEPVRIMGVLHAGHHQWDQYGGHASGPGTDHWGGT